ncbi:MAG: four helix bundle protein [Bacteroidetes bacterium]|nr:four helix bundle protein [Bacteroidota bacterium]
MKIERFEDIIAWKKSRILVKDIYKLVDESKDYGFRDQMRRASVSIMNNIAEGFERKSNKEFKQFLFIAKGSAAEVKSMLYVALDLAYLDKEKFDELFDLTEEITKILSGLIKTL